MASGVEYPFQVDDDDDHCETSSEAYEDVEAILGQLAEKIGKTRAELAIYDPYFCTGQVVQNLGAQNNRLDFSDFDGAQTQKDPPRRTTMTMPLLLPSFYAASVVVQKHHTAAVSAAAVVL